MPEINPDKIKFKLYKFNNLVLMKGEANLPIFMKIN